MFTHMAEGGTVIPEGYGKRMWKGKEKGVKEEWDHNQRLKGWEKKTSGENNGEVSTLFDAGEKGGKGRKRKNGGVLGGGGHGKGSYDSSVLKKTSMGIR